MSTSHANLPLEPIIGRWRTSGTVLDEQAAPVATIDGTDTYRFMAGRNWVVHEVDVMMGDDHVEVLEMIGFEPTSGSYTMRAFDAAGDFGTMTLTARDDRSLLAEGDGVRSTLWPSQDGTSMTALWERETAQGTWVRWMDMQFARLD